MLCKIYLNSAALGVTTSTPDEWNFLVGGENVPDKLTTFAECINCYIYNLLNACLSKPWLVVGKL